MSIKAMMKDINREMVKVALANKRVQARKKREVYDDEGIYMHSEFNSDFEGFREESIELRRQTLQELENQRRDL